MITVFNKYQGTGNDFIIIDNRKGLINQVDSVLINKLCDRRFGIGADGLILISGSTEYDFEMKYFNSDGFEGSMCGNGGRCSSAPDGTNVNFVEITGQGIYIRTFERGVEEETLSCGTGVTASAIASVLAGQIDTVPVKVRTKGGNLSVSFRIEGKSISDIWLSGPATFVFEGKVEV